MSLMLARAILRLVAPLLAGLLSLNLITLAWGRAQAAHPAMAGLAVCDLICWKDIEPGVTTRDQAQRLLVAAGYPNLLIDHPSYKMFFLTTNSPYICRMALGFKQGTVVSLLLEYCENARVQIGDIASILGIPERVIYARFREKAYELIYASGVPLSTMDRWSLFNRVRRLNIQTVGDNSAVFAWHGFVPRWRYCQLEPTYTACR
jgi:hypothetical protein